MSRRRFAALLAGAAGAAVRADAPAAAGRALHFVIDDGFGNGSAENIEAVLRSAAESIWQHCPHTRWETPGFFIYRTHDCPITLNEHQHGGRIAIGLATQDTLWSQFAYQFSHEFGHALAGHSNDWRRLHIQPPRPNHWLEESFCETASLFALRAMGQSWSTQPPYPNWRSYAGALADYAAKRLAEAGATLPAGVRFADWFRGQESALRANATIREKNNVVALHLLPVFERQPAGWEALTFYNRTAGTPTQTLAERFADWTAAAPEAQGAFIRQVAAVFAIKEGDRK